MHEKYDLKGSTYKRKADKYERSKESPTYKDLDFMEIHPEGISLEADTYQALVKTLQRDCRVLESFKIMDYSLLVGVHNLDLAAKEKAEKKNQETGDTSGRGTCGHSLNSEGSCFDDEVEGTSDAKRPLQHQSSNLQRSRSVKRPAFSGMDAIQAEVDPIDDEEDVP